MLRIDGERIYLRDHVASDLEGFHAWLSDPAVARFLTWRTNSVKESFIQLAEALRENDNPARTRFFFAMVLKDSDEMIGDAGFTILDRAETGGIAELGYFLLKPFWGQGYASEATELMLETCFTTLNLHKVVASCDAENKASERVMQKCGMTREAVRRRQTYRDGAWRDRLEYAIFVEDWLATRGKDKA